MDTNWFHTEHGNVENAFWWLSNSMCKGAGYIGQILCKYID